MKHLVRISVVTTIIICFVVRSGLSQSLESDEATYKAYLGYADIETTKQQWKKIVADRKSSLKPGDHQSLYQLSLAQFGLLSATMRDKDEALFDKYVDETEDNLEMLIGKSKTPAESRALLAALYGYTMGYSPSKGMFLGSKSTNLLERALKEDPASPLVWKLYANSKFFTPATWGGDIKEAIRSYEKSIQLYESDPQRAKKNWFYLDTIAFLGNAYAKDGQSNKAKEAYDKALKLEPGYAWVKHILLPSVK